MFVFECVCLCACLHKLYPLRESRGTTAGLNERGRGATRGLKVRAKLLRRIFVLRVSKGFSTLFVRGGAQGVEAGVGR